MTALSSDERMVFVSTVDRILDLLDNAGQQTSEFAYGDYDRGACWRCQGPPGEGASGVCVECREILLDEKTEPGGSVSPVEPITFAEFARRHAGDILGRRDDAVRDESAPWQLNLALELRDAMRRGEQLVVNMPRQHSRDMLMDLWMAEYRGGDRWGDFRVAIPRPPRLSDYVRE